MTNVDKDGMYSMKLKVKMRSNAHEGAKAMSAVNRALGSLAKGKSKHYVSSQARGNRAFLSMMPSGSSQRSTVVARFTNSGVVGAWKAHGSYLARENAQEQGRRGFGFDGESGIIDIGKTLDDWQNEGDERLWKIIVSPEFGDSLDLRTHTRELVTMMERDLETPLKWVAVDHYNTDNPHVHLLIRGKDDTGNKLDISRDYLKQGIRSRSSEIATNQLGYRGDTHDIMARQKQIESSRFTAMDKEILQGAKQKANGLMYTLPSSTSTDHYSQQRRMQTIDRLKVLEELKLAKYQENMTWKLSDNLQKSLQDFGTATAQMKILDRHRPLLTDQNQELTRTELKEPGERVTGIILGAGIDPEKDKPYLLIEGIDGKAHFILQSRKIEEGRLQDTLKDKTVVSIEVKQFVNNQKQTITYQEIKTHGGVNTALTNKPLLDKSILEGLGRQRLPSLEIANTGFASAFHKAMEQRAEALEKQGLIARLGGQAFITADWTTKYGAFRAEEIRQERGITAEVKPWTPSVSIGKIIHSEPSVLVVQGIKGDYCYLYLADNRFSKLEKGADVIIEAKPNQAGGVTINTLDMSALTQEVKQEKLGTLDTMLDKARGAIPQYSPMLEVSALLRERATVWQERGIDCKDNGFIQKAQEWGRKQEWNKGIER